MGLNVIESLSNLTILYNLINIASFIKIKNYDIFNCKTGYISRK
jgi:hypothetical protein